MKLAIKIANINDPVRWIKTIEDIQKSLGFPTELVEILLQNKEWAELNKNVAESTSHEEFRENSKKLEIYEKEQAKIDPNFREFLKYKMNLMGSVVKTNLDTIVSDINGESRHKLIKSIERLLFFGKPSKEKNSFFGLLFIILATTGILSVIGTIFDPAIRQIFGNLGPFSIEFLKNMTHGHSTFMNIASWYVAFEIMGLQGFRLLRKPIISEDRVHQLHEKIDEKLKEEMLDDDSNKKSSRVATKDGSYMAIQNLKTIKINAERLLNISKNPNFGPMITNEHAWAADHLAAAAENIDQVTDFFEAQFEVKAKKI